MWKAGASVSISTCQVSSAVWACHVAMWQRGSGQRRARVAAVRGEHAWQRSEESVRRNVPHGGSSSASAPTPRQPWATGTVETQRKEEKEELPQPRQPQPRQPQQHGACRRTAVAMTSSEILTSCGERPAAAG